MSANKEATPSQKNSLPTNDNTIVSCGVALEKRDGKLCVSSRLLADRMNIDHKSIVNSLTKHDEYFKKHGGYVVFKIRDKSKSGREKEAFLTEDQAYFLLSLSRNTEEVVHLKSDLVSAFSKLRRKHEILIDRHARLEWQQNRALGKYHRRYLTNDIKPFIKYAKAQGSTAGDRTYMIISKWINQACGVASVDNANECQLANLSSGCDVVLRIIAEGMAGNKNYKEIKKQIKDDLGLFGLLIAEAG